MNYVLLFSAARLKEIADYELGTIVCPKNELLKRLKQQDNLSSASQHYIHCHVMAIKGSQHNT